MKLKVCGVRNMAMVQACQDNLVDYIGFNFVPTSKRFISPEQAQGLSHSFTGRKVGVFQNAALSEVLQTLKIVDLDTIQLHGDETPTYIEELLHHLPFIIHHPPSIWKAFKVDENFDLKIMQQYSKNCSLFLFDGSNPGSGTKISDTNLLKQATKAATKQLIPYGIAGGVTAENVTELWQQFPQALLLDTASGVEVDQQFSADKLRQITKLCRDE